MGFIQVKATPVTVVSQGAHIREDLRGDVLRMRVGGGGAVCLIDTGD